MPDERGLINPINVPVESIHENLNQVVIVTTEDKLRNILHDYEGNLEKKKPWIAVLSVFLTLASVSQKTPVSGGDRRQFVAFWA